MGTPAGSEGAKAGRRSRLFAGYAVSRVEGMEDEVRGSAGVMFPFDNETVAFYCWNPEVATRLKRRLGTKLRVFCQGDGEVTFHFSRRLVPDVAAMAGVERRTRTKAGSAR